MKTALKLSLVLAVFALILAGCGTKDIAGPVDAKSGNIETFTPKVLTTAPIYAGNESIVAGELSVWDDTNNIYIKFDTVNGWMVGYAHYHLGYSLADIPMNGDIPVPGQFDYHEEFDPYVTTFTKTIAKSDYNFSVGDTILIAVHFELHKDLGGGEWQEETGWGGDIPGPGPRWWWYMWYVLTENGNGNGDECMEETAMLRMYDLPNDFTYRWMMPNGKPHAWFSYVKVTPTMTPETFYFYAGQTYKCGEADIWKEGDYLKIDLEMMNGWYLERVHLNVKLTGYQQPPAFGLFPYTYEYSPLADGDVFSIPWNSDWDGMELNIALHADAVKPCPEK